MSSTRTVQCVEEVAHDSAVLLRSGEPFSLLLLIVLLFIYCNVTVLVNSRYSRSPSIPDEAGSDQRVAIV